MTYTEKIDILCQRHYYNHDLSNDTIGFAVVSLMIYEDKDTVVDYWTGYYDIVGNVSFDHNYISDMSKEDRRNAMSVWLPVNGLSKITKYDAPVNRRLCSVHFTDMHMSRAKDATVLYLVGGRPECESIRSNAQATPIKVGIAQVAKYFGKLDI